MTLRGHIVLNQAIRRFSVRQVLSSNGIGAAFQNKTSLFDTANNKAPHASNSQQNFALWKNKGSLSVRWFSQNESNQVEMRENFIINMKDLEKAIKNDDIYIVDVRTQEECADGKIQSKRWVNVPVQEIAEALRLSEAEFKIQYGAPKPSKDVDDIVFHCRAGVRSTIALHTATQQGYKKCRHYPDGWLGWESDSN